MDHHQRFRNGGNNNGGRGPYRRYSRSRSRSRERVRDRLNYRDRDRGGYRYGNNDNDLYRDIIDQDYQDEQSYMGGGGGGGGNSRGNNKFRPRGNDDDYGDDRCERYYNERPRNPDRDRDYDNRDRRDCDRDRDNKTYGAVRGDGNGGNGGGGANNNRRYDSVDREHNDRDSDESDYSNQNQTPSNTITVLGLQSHITEADIMSLLIQADMAPAAIRLIRKYTTGSSRGFAFVEFNTTEEAAQWMEYTQGTLQVTDTCRATLQYSHLKNWNCVKCGTLNYKRRGKCFKCHTLRSGNEPSATTDPDDTKHVKGGKGDYGNRSEWFCDKCNVFNFRRRDTCFKCCASRGDCGYVEEISSIITKRIMINKLDVLTNEEGVLTAITKHAPDLAKNITKVHISRDALTQTSRGICYLNFDSLVDSMNVHNLLSTLEPPLTIDEKEVSISYCVDHEHRQAVLKKKGNGVSNSSQSAISRPMSAAELAASSAAFSTSSVGAQYTLDDVPRLAEYSAALYATTPAEHAHYLQYYTKYYIDEITSGSYTSLPTDNRATGANSGAAVASSAIKRKQAKMKSIETTATAAKAATHIPVVTPKGNDGKVYATPDVSLYQYDETSGYYYDPTTGLYYDAHSQYYYNNETGAYLYWDQRKSTYILATPAAVAAAVQAAVKQESETPPASSTAAEGDTAKKEKKDGGGGGHKHDKVKVAKKIVKDMEKWAKQLNQKKDYVPVATPQTSQTSDDMMRPSTSAGGLSSGYADVGFSILEKKAANKLGSSFMSPMTPSTANKLIPAYGSDSEEDVPPPPPKISGSTEASEKDYVDFQKLTCLLCKRAFQSLEILQKHLKMSNLHKENLAKLNAPRGGGVVGGGGSTMHSDEDNETSLAAALSYRDRAKERRQKYGEYDPPPPNPSRERFQKEIKNLTSRSKEAPIMPIGSNNVGNRLLQKMGWSEGQGLGRKNQGRTNIIEANARNSNAGLGTQPGPGIAPGHDDYKTYIKKMMKSRYESA